MGAASTKYPEVGVPINPRVNYAETRSKQERKAELIDAPILVRLEKGTLRYRTRGEDSVGKTSDRIELAHEGPERSKKHGYFYHATLNDFSADANYDKEEEWKFKYVYKGPNKWKQKKVFYVYGKGFGANPAGGIVKDINIKPEGKGYNWPSVFKVPGHVYYDLQFSPQEENAENDEEIDMTEQAQENEEIKMAIGKRDRMQKLSKRLATRLVKPIISIHVFYGNKELKPQTMLADLSPTGASEWSYVKIALVPK